ncbi:ACT domain-containing protein [Lineolata rhizophorae]|uniref:ACT domain-containing protein n=1 Tax=Lineolata rhizophorae TaxID=578093 RepID=A0A6A6NVC2_9PEZI|nr:ACT domain-containing protein [Lineolata rhizophorae]
MLLVQDTQLALIHIPLELYSSFLQPILQLLFLDEDECRNETADSWAYDHPFVNISVTPIECSIACSRDLADELFVPVREALGPRKREVSITAEDYIVMQVDGEGLDAGQRVLELTSPLAMAGISIFFITTYFSDYILVPLRSRGQVISALEKRGFAFDHHSSVYMNNPAAAATTTSSLHHRNASSTTSLEALAPPGTPPPTSVSELQAKTFDTLRRRHIAPSVDPSIKLVHAAAAPTPPPAPHRRPRPSSPTEDRLHLGLVKCLIARPRFLSLTLTDAEPASVLLEQRLLAKFGAGPGAGVLLGAKQDVLVPVTLDLRALPLESTGIVCGVAGRLVGGTAGARGVLEPVEMSYLSTARAGTVMVAEEELERALSALRGMGEGG